MDGNDAHAWINDMFNHALRHGMSYYWTTNWIKPLHKGGDINNVNNYRTIMVGSLIAKLFGCIMESKISVWAEKNGKRAYGQAGFRKHHSTIDHFVTLRELMEGSRLRGKGLYYCFVDFKKAFDMVPHEHLWIKVPSKYTLAIFRIYVQRLHVVVCMGDRHSDFFQ